MLRRLTALLSGLIISTVITSCVYAAGITATVKEIRGEVKAQPSPGAEWIPATVGMKLGENASVRTGGDAQAIITWPGKAVAVKPLSVVVIGALKEMISGIELKEGAVFSKVSKLKEGGEFFVRTPSAYAGVRGTAFEVTVNSVTVYEGTVSVAAGGIERMVDAGFTVTISPEGVPGVPSQIPAESIKNLEKSDDECKKALNDTEQASAGSDAGQGRILVDAENASGDVKQIIDKIDTSVIEMSIERPGAITDALKINIDIEVTP